MLSNAYFLAKFRFDTAENEPAKNLQNFRKMHFRKCIFETRELLEAVLGVGPEILVVDPDLLAHLRGFVDRVCRVLLNLGRQRFRLRAREP